MHYLYLHFNGKFICFVHPFWQAVAELGWTQPTLIQEKAIPLALEGKDLLARARTGSGKTAAYAVPLIQRLLTSKQTVREQAVRALILVPTKELGQQVQAMIRQLTAYCARDIRVADISGKTELSAQRPILMEKPDVVVGTPSRVQAHIKAQNLELNALEMLVIDEADLLFSFGFEDDVKSLICHLPKIYQAFLMSATLNDDVQALKELVLHNPVTLKLQGSQLPDSSQLQQYSVKCEEEDKFLLIYTLLKLGLFNQGFYDYIIATDEQGLNTPTADSSKEGKAKKKKKNTKSKKGKDKEYGVARGVDFQNIANVINFDFPTSVESYIHRVGRTARADNKGSALTFVSHSELSLLEEVESVLTGDSGDCALKTYGFKMDEIEGFRYRCRDAMRSVTKQAVKEARLKEIKHELLNSEKLKVCVENNLNHLCKVCKGRLLNSFLFVQMYFEDNPRDLQLLRHDKDLHPAIIKPHLRNVPDYLVPTTMKNLINPLLRRKKKKQLKTNPKGVIKTAFKKNIRGKNPLKSFRYTGNARRQKNKS
ncbi:putative ATP-dependent RNA helicase DDX56 [Bagarius yarrelli]|uniref:RNA helicase n=1 Tax=Bagarius yarrelli TaxID=175774 RepID=A0A556U3A8_BAGYA|nr:putative ATP-dependent RNA helicase DDX56 [Bagarius yarrelli]